LTSGYARKGPSVCTSLTIDKESIEAIILNTVRDHLLSANFQVKLRDALREELRGILPDLSTKQTELETRLAESEKRISSLLALVEKGVSVDTIAERIRSLEDEKAGLRQEIAKLQCQNESKESLPDIAEESRMFVEKFVTSFDQLTLAEKKEGMKKLMKDVIVDRDKRVAHCHIRTIPPFKHHPILEFLRGSPLPPSTKSKEMSQLKTYNLAHL
jgi:hypothetical protein